MLGLPKQLKDDDVQCEYPVDADDEYVTERGFQPTLPGESTKLSSALALFRAARILSKVLEEVFPARASYELSMKKLSDLSDELDAWNNSLAPHLRLHFSQDKPSTGTISSRSPLLSLTYHWIRCLIQRPAVCASLGSRSSSSMMTLASSCKHMIQIVQLLEERGMSFSFCLNRDEMLVLSGFGLLFQGLSLEETSKVLKDNSRMVAAVIKILDKSKAPCAPEFGRVARSFLPTPSTPPPPVQVTKPTPPKATVPPKSKVPAVSRHNSDSAVVVNPIASLPASTKKQLKAIASRFSASGQTKPPRLDAVGDHRRATVPSISLHPHGVPSHSQPSLQPNTSLQVPTVSRSEPSRSPNLLYNRYVSDTARPSAPPQPPARPLPKARAQSQRLPNLDYLSFGNEAGAPSSSKAAKPIKTEPPPTDWEKLLGSLDNGETNIFDACYGGQPVEALRDSQPLGMHHSGSASTTAVGATATSTDWDDATADLWALCQVGTNTSSTSGITNSNGHPDSVFSFSTDEGTGRTSSDEFTAGDWCANVASGSETDFFRGIVMPAELGQGDDGNLESAWDAALNF